MLVVYLGLDRRDRELPKCAIPIPIDFCLGRLIDPVLSLTCVKVEEVDHAERVSVLVCVEDEAELVEQELGVEFGDLRVGPLVHDEATGSRHGLQDELMLRSVVLARDELGELCDRLVYRVTRERGGIGIEVDGERVEGSELVNRASRVGDKSGLPFRVGRDHREVREGDSDREWVTRHRDLVFVPDVEVFDLNRGAEELCQSSQ